MPEPRIRDVVGRGNGIPRARSSTAKAAGDSTACNICSHQEIFRSSSKHKTPRSVRYDLENALVGLCDVWFGEIKPYLVRNNIKLHVNSSSAGGDHQRQVAAGADHQRPIAAAADHQRPIAAAADHRRPIAAAADHRRPIAAAADHRRPIAAAANHQRPIAVAADHQRPIAAAANHQRPVAAASPCFDPGAAPDNPPRTARYAGSSARPAARTLRRAPTADCTRSRRPLPPLLSVPLMPHDGTQSHNNEQKKVRQPCIRRRSRRRTQPEPNWRVPRLCRTFTVLCRPGAGASSRAVKTASHPPPHDHYRFIKPRRKSGVKNKSTQTEQAPSVSRGCQSLWPRYRNPSPRRPSPLRPSPPRPSPLRPSPRHTEPWLVRTSSSKDSASPPPILPPRIICRLKLPKTPAAEMPPLLQDDLIDIIAEGNEKRLKLLYSNSEKDDRGHPSFMNLILNSRQEKPDYRKLPPWR